MRSAGVVGTARWKGGSWLQIERHRVEPLRIFALTHSVAVGKDVSTMKQLDYADMTADIARQPRVRRRIDHLHPNAVAYCEACWLR
jgi:hypothetical protein